MKADEVELIAHMVEDLAAKPGCQSSVSAAELPDSST